MRFFLLILCIISAQHLGYTQGVMVFDTSRVEKRNFNPAAIREYKADPDFQYDRIVEPPESVLDRIWNWFWAKIGRMLGTREGERAFYTFFFILAFLILLYFMLKVSGMSIDGMFGKKNKVDELEYSIVDNDIHSIDFDTAIREAVLGKNFRLAVRLLYLQSLKNLTGLGLISWQINKTNKIYEKELEGNACRQNFHALTLQFENNWYGDVPIDETEFIAIRELFDEFNRQIQ